MALFRPSVVTLGPEERTAKLAEVGAFYDDHSRGMDGMQRPHVTRCFCADVIDRAEVTTERPGDASHQDTVASDGTDTDMLLIDLR